MSSVLSNYPNIITSLIPTYIQLVSSPALLNQVAPTLPFKISEESAGERRVRRITVQCRGHQHRGREPQPGARQQIAAATTAAFLARVRGNGVVTAQIYGKPEVPDPARQSRGPSSCSR